MENKNEKKLQRLVNAFLFGKITRQDFLAKREQLLKKGQNK